jgi:hypothetical protein
MEQKKAKTLKREITYTQSVIFRVVDTFTPLMLKKLRLYIGTRDNYLCFSYKK